MPKKILIFDFDGTIADTVDAAREIYNKIAEEHHFPLITKENFAELRNRSAIENMRAFKIPLLKLPLIVKKVRAALKEEVAHLSAIPGAPEAIRELKAKGYGLYIVSSNSAENILRFLTHNQMTEFDGAYGVSNIFGKHTKIKQLMKEHAWDPAQVMYIGDEARDIDAAKKAHVTSVAVTWGYNTEEALRRNQPDRILRNPSELSSL